MSPVRSARRSADWRDRRSMHPGRHQIGTVGEIISESWARSNRHTRARSSESAVCNLQDRIQRLQREVGRVDDLVV